MTPRCRYSWFATGLFPANAAGSSTRSVAREIEGLSLPGRAPNLASPFVVASAVDDRSGRKSSSPCSMLRAIENTLGGSGAGSPCIRSFAGRSVPVDQTGRIVRGRHCPKIAPGHDLFPDTDTHRTNPARACSVRERAAPWRGGSSVPSPDEKHMLHIQFFVYLLELFGYSIRHTVGGVSQGRSAHSSRKTKRGRWRRNRPA